MLNEKEFKQNLFDKRVLLIDDKIERNLMDETIGKLFYLGVEGKMDDIHIVFNSPGGSPQCGLSIYDVICSLPMKKFGYVFTKCHSASLYPLLACDVRIGLPSSRFLMHSMESSFTFKLNHPGGLSLENQAKHAIDEAQQLNNRKSLIFQKHLNISREKVDELENRGDNNGYSLFAKEAKELGILTDIYDFSSEMPWIWNVAKFAK